jgi:exportin-T
MLQRSYFSFLAALVNNDVAEVLSMQEPSDLHQVLVTVIQGAVDIPDPQGQKVCYGILRRLIEIWAGKEGGMNGFADYVYDSIVPACFLGPLKPSFDMSDAQTVLVLSECAMCLKTVLDKRGEELVIFLQTKYLPSLNLSPELCQEFCQALSTADKKMFKNYFKSFFMRAKT